MQPVGASKAVISTKFGLCLILYVQRYEVERVSEGTEAALPERCLPWPLTLPSPIGLLEHGERKFKTKTRDFDYGPSH